MLGFCLNVCDYNSEEKITMDKEKEVLNICMKDGRQLITTLQNLQTLSSQDISNRRSPYILLNLLSSLSWNDCGQCAF